jgi:hypothetical protein
MKKTVYIAPAIKTFEIKTLNMFAASGGESVSSFSITGDEQLSRDGGGWDNYE